MDAHLYEPRLFFPNDEQPNTAIDNCFTCLFCSDQVVFPKKNVENEYFSPGAKLAPLTRLTEPERKVASGPVHAYVAQACEIPTRRIALDFHCPRCGVGFVVGFYCVLHPHDFLLSYRAEAVWALR